MTKNEYKKRASLLGYEAKYSGRLRMGIIKGKNTNNTLFELEVIRFEMKNTNFDYDGVIPETALEEVEADIDYLIKEKIKKDCTTKDGKHLWIYSKKAKSSYCIYCQKEI